MQLNPKFAKAAAGVSLGVALLFGAVAARKISGKAAGLLGVFGCHITVALAVGRSKPSHQEPARQS